LQRIRLPEAFDLATNLAILNKPGFHAHKMSMDDIVRPTRLFWSGDSLAVFSNRGRLGADKSTRKLVTVRPDILVYEVDGKENVDILRVWHSPQSRA
jgi:hypothetical protein